MTAPVLETPRGDIMNVSQALAINMMRRADEVEAEPQAEMHQRMELPPAVVVGVEEEGFREEEQDVREEGRGEHAHQVVRELRIQDDEHERQERSEGRGEREGDGEELRELVREPVVSQISGLVADRLDDEREDWDGKDERREQQVELRDRPDGHAAPDDGKRPVLGLRVGLCPGLALPRRPSRRPVPAARGVGVDGRGRSPVRLPVFAAHERRGHPHGPGEHHEAGDGTEKDQQLAVHRAVHHAVRHGASLTWSAAGAPVALASRLRSSSRT